MAAIDHPFRREIEALRRLVLGVHPSVAEGGIAIEDPEGPLKWLAE